MQLLCRHRMVMSKRDHVERTLQLCNLLVADLKLPRQQLLPAVLRVPQLALHKSPEALVKKYKVGWSCIFANRSNCVLCIWVV